MKVYFLLLALLLLACRDKDEVNVNGTLSNENKNSQKIININKSEYAGEMDKSPELIVSYSDIIKNIRYPEVQKNKRVQGRVYVRLYINEKGNIDYSEVMVGIDSVLNQAALDGLKGIKFKPAMLKNNPVKTKVIIPVDFKLDDYREGETLINTSKGKRSAVFSEDVDKPAEPEGGITALLQNINYPEKEKKNGIEGRVVVKAEIDEYGYVIIAYPTTNLGIRNFSIAAVDAVKKTKFIPAIRDGKKVKSSLTIPFNFKLN